MKRLTPVALIAVAAVVAIVVAGCGSDNNGSATAASSSGTTVKTSTGKLGTFLVDGRGRTLYLFEADKPNMSTCASACQSVWPAVPANGKKPIAQGGVAAAKLGTAKTPDGTSIVTYNGHPLYNYVGDPKAGDTNGEGLNDFGAKWYAVTPAGAKIDND
jgi:predicted lipoprotein with Yx(FWY)xxD motif